MGIRWARFRKGGELYRVWDPLTHRLFIILPRSGSAVVPVLLRARSRRMYYLPSSTLASVPNGSGSGPSCLTEYEQLSSSQVWRTAGLRACEPRWYRATARNSLADQDVKWSGLTLRKLARHLASWPQPGHPWPLSERSASDPSQCVPCAIARLTNLPPPLPQR